MRFVENTIFNFFYDLLSIFADYHSDVSRNETSQVRKWSLGEGGAGE